MESIDFPETQLALHTIPPRPDTGVPGTQLLESLSSIPVLQVPNERRDQLFLEQCLQGNIPVWMRTFKPISVQDDKNHLIYFISPDLLCLGTDSDFVRISLNGFTAKKVVDAFGCLLPTKKMSDQIWQTADLRLMPVGMGASFNMSSSLTLGQHNGIIEKQRAERNFNIISGHKKDIVLAKSLVNNPSRLAIYGWFKPDGTPVQDLNTTSHAAWYQDYSSGIRLVSRQGILNGENIDLYDLLANPLTAYLISHESSYRANRIYL